MVGVQVKVDNTKLINALKLYLNKDFKTPLSQIGPILVRSTNENFKKEQSPDGVPWKDLSGITQVLRATKLNNPKYRPSKSRSGWYKILQDTGRLKNSVTSNVIQNVTETTFEFGTNVKYARTHHFGGKAQIVVTRSNKNRKYGTSYTKTINVPARPFLGIKESDKEKIKRVFIDFFKGKLKNA